MEKRFVIGLLFALLFSIPSALSLPFIFELSEKYSGVHTENLWPCWDKSLSINLSGVFPVHDARFRAGYLTGVCDHVHWFAGGVRLLLGNDVRDDFTVKAYCSKCGYPWYSNDFGGQFASSVEVCGGDDNGGKMTWGGWGGYPYEFSYNKQAELGRVDRDKINYLGSVDDYFDEYSGLKGEEGWSITVSTDNPEVMVWFDDDPSVKKTTDTDAIVAACADTNKNDVCDVDEKVFSDCVEAGGDWYRGKCCGVDYGECDFVGAIERTIFVKQNRQGIISDLRSTFAYGFTEVPARPLYVLMGRYGIASLSTKPGFNYELYTKPSIYVRPYGRTLEVSDSPVYGYEEIVLEPDGISALCGKNADDEFEWAPVGEPGEIHELFGCPGGSVVSDGLELYQCDGQHDNTTTIAQKGFQTVSVDGFMHDYFCIGKSLYECGGSGSTFSSINFKETGDIAPGSATTCPSDMVGYWSMDGNLQDSVFGNNGDNHNVLFGTGKVNQAAVFTGDGSVRIVDTPVLNPDIITIEAWISLPDEQKSGTNTIVHKDGAYQLVVNDGVLQGAVQLEDGPLWSLEGTADVPTGAWAHVAMIYDGNDLTLYLNGDEVDSVNMPGSIASSTSRLFIGEASDLPPPSADAFYGSIDEVAIYDGIVLPVDLKSHHDAPGNYCPTITFDVPETYYCASDGDWTKDLDIKDRESCDLSGYTGTGAYCCSEDDDLEEYYNDPLGTAKSIDEIMVADSGTVEMTGDNLTLDESGAWAEFAGPAQLEVYEFSVQERTAGEFRDCKYLGKDFVQIKPGESSFVYVVEPVDPDPANTDCVLRRKEIVVESTPGFGGCWNKGVVRSGDYAPVPGQKVLNYAGRFYGCNITDQNLLALNDSHVPPPATVDDPANQLINNSVQRCGYVFYDASGDAEEPHIVCSPGGDWESTADLIGEFEKDIEWTIPVNVTGISYSGCCAADQCWNGTACQPLHSYYRVLDQGYVCEFPEDVPSVDLPPPPSLCTDSDGGKDYFVEGATNPGGWEPEDTDACIEFADDSTAMVVDECVVADIKQEGGKCALRETYCDGDIAKYEYVACYDCKDGVCNDLP